MGGAMLAWMYTATSPPPALAHGFSSLATWTQTSAAWSGVLSADPGFELAWTEREGEVVGACLTPASRSCGLVASGGGPRRVRILRLRTEAVGAWLGDAAELVDGGRVDLCNLGAKWRPVAGARTEAELFAALARIEVGEKDPVVLHSVARLREPLPPAFPQIAHETGYSYEQWRRRMRAATGVSPKFLARYLRLQRASKLAKARPAMSMGEVAFRTGFASDCVLAAESSALAGRTFRALVAGYTLPE